MAVPANDLFTDINGTSLTAHTMDTGGGWVAVTGTFEVQSNRAEPNSHADADLIRTEVNASDLTLTCDVTPFNSGGVESDPDLLLRLQDSTHFWLIHITSSGGEIQLIETNGGAGVIKKTATHGFLSGSTYAITIHLTGPTITCYVDGAYKWTYDSATLFQTATKFGLRCGKAGSPATKASWDNFRITTADLPGSIPFVRSGPSLNGSPWSLQRHLVNRPAITAMPPGQEEAATPANQGAPPPFQFLLPMMQIAPWQVRSPLNLDYQLNTPGAPAVVERNSTFPLTFGPPMPNAPWTRIHGPGTIDFGGKEGVKPVAPVGTSTVRDRTFILRVPQAGDVRRQAHHTEQVANLLNSLIKKGHIQRAHQGDFVLIGGGFEEPRAPTVKDDITVGATAGCTWIDTTSDTAYICLDNSAGSAVWVVIGGVGGGSGGGGLTGDFF